jgi:hypothetical protein
MITEQIKNIGENIYTVVPTLFAITGWVAVATIIGALLWRLVRSVRNHEW